MKKLLSTLLILSLFFTSCGAKSSGKYVSREKLKAHTEYITQDIGVRLVGTNKEKEAADYIYNQLSSYGFSEANGQLVRQPFSANGNDSENIIATRQGDKNKIIIVIAHHDSVASSMGAKDNATGSAALLEIARVLFSAGDVSAELRFISLGSEENGYHGSEYYVSTLSKAEKENILAVYNIDISAASLGDGFIPVCTTLGGRVEGEYKIGNGFDMVDNAVSKSIEKAFIALGYFKLEEEGTKYKRVFHYGESDHISFHNAGIDSGNVCWRKLDGDRASLPTEYHQMTDTAENVDYKTTEITANAIVEAVKILDKE